MATQHCQVLPNDRVVYAEACALASSYAFSLLASTVHRYKSSLFEHSLSLAKYANCNILHHNISPAGEQALFFQSTYCLRAIFNIVYAPHAAPCCTVRRFHVVREMTHSFQL